MNVFKNFLKIMMKEYQKLKLAAIKKINAN
jgi:hypothetical protein